MAQGYRHCPTCDGFIRAGAAVCNHCGTVMYAPVAPVATAPTAPVSSHSPGKAAALSLLLIFAGQLYNRQYTKAVVGGMAAMVFMVITGGIGVLVAFPAFMIDAWCIAGRLQRGETVAEWQCF